MEFRELVIGALVGGLLGWLALRSWYAARLASAVTERDVLRERVETEVSERMDLDALAEVRKIETTERARLGELLGG